MNTLHPRLCGPLVVALLLASAGARAIPLSDLYAGGSLTAGNVLQFDQFKLVYQNRSTGVSVPDPTRIEVRALDDGGTNPGPGLNFTVGNEFTVNGDGLYAFIDYTLGFRVTTLNGQPIIEDNLLTINEGFIYRAMTGTQDLGMAIVEKLSDAFGNQLVEKYVEFSELGTPYAFTSVLTDHAAWKPGVNEVFVEKNILVWSANRGDIASLERFEQRFSIPEPSSLLLFNLALAGLGLIRRGDKG